MENQSIHNTSNINLAKQPFQNIHTHNRTIFIFSRPIHLNLVMAIFGIVLIAINGGLLFYMHKRRKILKAKRFIFLFNLTFCDLTSGLILIFLAALNAIESDGPWVCLLQGESCLSLCLTMCSYTCSIIIQFIAVRYPLYYKTTITKGKIILIIIGCWIYSIGFAILKFSYAFAANHHSEKTETFSFFPFIDLILKITYVVGNCACFSYVLKIALQRRRQQHVAVGSVVNKNQRRSMDEEKIENEDIDKKVDERTPFRRQAMNFLHHYQAIVTSGMRLLVYIFTSLPLTIFCTYVLVKETSVNTETYEVFWESRDLGVALVLLWFSRAIIDPLITIIREKPMLPRRTSSMDVSEGSLRLASISHCRAESLGFDSRVKPKERKSSQIECEILGNRKKKSNTDNNENIMSDREM